MYPGADAGLSSDPGYLLDHGVARIRYADARRISAVVAAVKYREASFAI
jgi:hypothetical protein